MLNVVDDMRAALAADSREAAYAHCADIQRAHIDVSRRAPYRQIAAVLAVIYAALIIAGGILVRLLSRRRPSSLERSLAEAYCAVPEMILHKSIELTALVDHDYEGRGLDLGCGDGIVGGLLANEAGLDDLHGVDISAVDEAGLLSRGYQGYRVSDIQALPYDEATFDYVVSVCVIEHVPDLQAVLAEAARVLRPGGRFYFTTPSPAYAESLMFYRLLRAVGLTRRAGAFLDFRDIMAMHYHYLTPEGWNKALIEAGFSDIRTDPIFSRRQLLAYDVLNIQAYFLKFYFYERLAALVHASKTFRRVMVWGAVELCSFLARRRVTPENATHYSIACIRT